MAEQGKPKRKGYQWPCSCLTAEEMAILFRLREQTGRPISRLLCEAVRRFELQIASNELPKMDNDKERQGYESRKICNGCEAEKEIAIVIHPQKPA